MAWTTLTLQVTTPLFNGGADPADEGGFRAADEAGVRAASIRGAMRFWFRALAGAFTGPDVRLLAAMERRVFGGITSQRSGAEAGMPSPLILRIPDPPRLRYDSAPDFLRASQRRWIAYLLGLGLMKVEGSRFELTRPFVPPDPNRSFDLRIRFQHARQATDEMRHAVETLAFASLWLACAYGGFGARTRRGFGGVRITGGDGTMPRPWTPKSIRTPGLEFYKAASVWPDPIIRVLGPHLRELAIAERKEFAELDSWDALPPYPVLSRRFAPAALTPQPRGSWEEVLGNAGRQLRLFRANRPYDRQDRQRAQVNTAEWDEVVQGDDSDFPLGSLGLPVGFHDKKTKHDFTVNALSATDGEQLRRASSLWLRSVGQGAQWRLFTFAFQGRFLPSADTATIRLLPGDTARRDGQRERELFVDQECLASLTGQWLDTMRDGGDFATVIRD